MGVFLPTAWGDKHPGTGAVKGAGPRAQPCNAEQRRPRPAKTGPGPLPCPAPSPGTRAAPGEDPDKPSPSTGLVTVLHPLGHTTHLPKTFILTPT